MKWLVQFSIVVFFSIVLVSCQCSESKNKSKPEKKLDFYVYQSELGFLIENIRNDVITTSNEKLNALPLNMIKIYISKSEIIIDMRDLCDRKNQSVEDEAINDWSLIKIINLQNGKIPPSYLNRRWEGSKWLALSEDIYKVWKRHSIVCGQNDHSNEPKKFAILATPHANWETFETAVKAAELGRKSLVYWGVMHEQKEVGLQIRAIKFVRYLPFLNKKDLKPRDIEEHYCIYVVGRIDYNGMKFSVGPTIGNRIASDEKNAKRQYSQFYKNLPKNHDYEVDMEVVNLWGRVPPGEMDDYARKFVCNKNVPVGILRTDARKIHVRSSVTHGIDTAELTALLKVVDTFGPLCSRFSFSADYDVTTGQVWSALEAIWNRAKFEELQLLVSHSFE